MARLSFFYGFIFMLLSAFSQKDSIEIKKIRFVNYTEIGLAKNDQNFMENQTRFSFQTINGIELNKKMSIGIGVGLDRYLYEDLIPLFLDFRRNIIGVKHGLFFELSSGVFIKSNKDSWIDYAPFVYPQIGYRVAIVDDINLTISFGYQYRLVVHRPYEYWDQENSALAVFQVPNANRVFYPIKIGVKF